MIALVFPFERGRYLHRLVARDGRVCLVERTSTHPDSRGKVHWEVVVLQHAKERKVRGTILPAAEQYPSSGQWGKCGWTYTTLVEAEARFTSLGGRRAFQQATEPPTPGPTPTKPPSGRASEEPSQKTGHSGGGT